MTICRWRCALGDGRGPAGCELRRPAGHLSLGGRRRCRRRARQGLLGQPVHRPRDRLSRRKRARPASTCRWRSAVQKMVNAAAAGVAMTLDPVNGDRSKIVIDAGFGLGEPVVSGEITPDNFVVDKVMLRGREAHGSSTKHRRAGRRPRRRAAPCSASSSRRAARMPSLTRCAGAGRRARSPRRSRAQYGLPAGRRVGDRRRSARRRKRRRSAEPPGDRLEPEEARRRATQTYADRYRRACCDTLHRACCRAKHRGPRSIELEESTR